MKCSLVVSLLFLALNLNAKDDFKVTVTGTVRFLDPLTSTVHPLVGARIEIWDSDIDGQIHFPMIDDFMGETTTDINGNFSRAAEGGDVGSYHISRPDVYIKVVLINADGKLRLTDEWNNTQYYVSDMHNHDNSEGNVNMGTFIVTGGELVQVDRGNRLQVWMGALDAYNNFVNTVGPIPSNFYDVEYFWGWDTGTPWTNLNTTHWPNTYPTGEGTLPFRTSFHEFAHTVRHSLDGSEAHFLGDNAKYTYARSHNGCPTTNEGFAFNEGWAEFWSGELGSDRVEDRSFENECHVTFLLRQLQPNFPGGRRDMVEVLRQNPESIHSISDYCKATNKLFPAACPFQPVTTSTKIPIPATLIMGPIIRQDFLMFIDRQKKYSEDLRSKIAAAGINADVSLLCEKGDCEGVFKKIITPFLLKADKEINDYMITLLSQRAKDSMFVRKKIKERNFEKWQSGYVTNYRRKIAEVSVKYLTAAIRATDRLRGKKEFELLRKELNEELKVIKSRTALTNKRLPTNLYPSFAGDELRKE